MRLVLVLYRHPTGTAMRPAIDAHLRSLERALRAEDRNDRVIYHNAYDEAPPAWVRALEPDAVVLHTTFLCMRWSDHFGAFSWQYRWLGELACAKIAIPQDEYDHSEILDEWLNYLRVTHLFTNFDARQRELIYPILRHSDVRFREVLTGYIDERMAGYAITRMRPLRERPMDIVYRASRLPYWFGEHGQLKHRIGDVVAERSPPLGLRTDISTRNEDVIYGAAWTDFLLSGRAVIGAESGSSALDRRGEVRAAFETVLAAEPDLSFAEASSHLPDGWDGYPLGAISPRHFEAVVTKTCQVLVEGRFSSVLEAGRHYLPVKRDLSNLDQVLEQLRDDELLTKIAETAYADVYLSGRYTYAVFGAAVASACDDGETPNTVRRGANAVALHLGPIEDVGRRSAARAATRLRIRSRRPLRASRAAPYLRRMLQAVPTTGPRIPRIPVAFRSSTAADRRARVESTRRQMRLIRLIGKPALQAPVRSILVHYVVTGAWRAVHPRAVAKDLLRLALAGRTQSLAELRAAARGGSSWLVWDHGEIGPFASIDEQAPELGVVALDDEPYEFSALTELWRRWSDAAGRGPGE